MECDICRLNFLASSLKSHLKNAHGIFQADVIDKEYLETHPGCVYRARQLVDGTFQYLVPGCVGEATSKWTLRRHFRHWHPLDSVLLLGEGVLPSMLIVACKPTYLVSSRVARVHNFIRMVWRDGAKSARGQMRRSCCSGNLS